MQISVRLIVHGLLLVLGLALMVGGIVAAKHGAVVIGLIVAAVNVQQYLKRNKATTHNLTGHAG